MTRALDLGHNITQRPGEKPQTEAKKGHIMEHTIYTTKTDAVEEVILPSLGDFVADFDIDGIFLEAFAYDAGRRGFVRTTDDDDAYWVIVERHANR